jgi:hypothetical protein
MIARFVERLRGTYFGVRVSELDSNIPDELVLESNRHDSGDCFYNCRLSVRDMSDGTYNQNSDTWFDA